MFRLRPILDLVEGVGRPSDEPDSRRAWWPLGPALCDLVQALFGFSTRVGLLCLCYPSE